MPVSDIEKAATFLRGVGSGDADLAIRYVDPDNYVEHAPTVADGVVGLTDHVVFLPNDGAALRIVRALQDGAFVVTQTQGDLLGRNVFFDVFRFEEGLIVEHWLFAAKDAPPNKSGHTQVDGPTTPQHLEDTAMNKATVRTYYEAVHLAGRPERAREWFLGDLMIRHEPQVADGASEFLRDLKVLTRDRTIDTIKILAGEGDLVFLAAQGTHQGAPCAYVDLYRVQEGKIVEHWGFPEPIPPAHERLNANGML